MLIPHAMDVFFFQAHQLLVQTAWERAYIRDSAFDSDKSCSHCTSLYHTRRVLRAQLLGERGYTALSGCFATGLKTLACGRKYVYLFLFLFYFPVKLKISYSK
jgi:hypothetical protein